MRELEKTIMFGKIVRNRQRGTQWIKWIDEIKYITGMSLEELQVIIRHEAR